MAKQGEIDYLSSLGPRQRDHAIGKPYSDPDCGMLLGRVGQIMELLPPPPARILELGCGTGWVGVMLARRGYDVVGRDIAPEMIECANELKAREGIPEIDFGVADYESLGSEADFDGVVFFDSLHHAENETLALGQAFRALREGGVCVLSEPGVGHSESEAAINAIDRYGVTEKDMPPPMVKRIAKSVGFRRASVHPHLGQMMGVVSGRGASRRKGLTGWLLQRAAMRPLILMLVATLWKRRSGVVALVK